MVKVGKTVSCDGSSSLVRKWDDVQEGVESYQKRNAREFAKEDVNWRIGASRISLVCEWLQRECDLVRYNFTEGVPKRFS